MNLRTLEICLALIAAAPLSFAQQPQQAPGSPQTLTPAQQKAAALRLPSLDRSSLLPTSRQPVQVREDEKSVFGGAVAAPSKLTAKLPVTEEKRIRDLLSNLRVNALSGSSGSQRALMGPLSVGEGDVLPPLFAGQAEKLKVRSVSDRSLVFEFIETDTNKPPRTIEVPVSLEPRVDSLLVGEMFLKLVPLGEQGTPVIKPSSLKSADAVLEATKQQEMKSMVERRTELFNAPAMLESDEKTKK